MREWYSIFAAFLAYYARAMSKKGVLS